jgi:hypothetical protein
MKSRSRNGGRREDRVSNAPAASYAKVESIRVSRHRFTGSLRPSLRNGFNGFFRARPGDRALLSPWVTTLARCTGYQRRDIRPTRLRRPLVRAFVLCVTSVHRIPRPTFCDDRETPLYRGGTREQVPVICPTSQAKIPATQWHDGQISLLFLMVRSASRPSRLSGSEAVSERR